jgi:photosystem II stability/assembly factor-like uncharacterized protein
MNGHHSAANTRCQCCSGLLLWSTRAVVITADAGGAAWTPDEGSTWFTLPDVTGYWAVAFASPKAGWLVGTGGRILKITFSAARSELDPN